MTLSVLWMCFPNGDFSVGCWRFTPSPQNKQSCICVPCKFFNISEVLSQIVFDSACRTIPYPDPNHFWGITMNNAPIPKVCIL